MRPGLNISTWSGKSTAEHKNETQASEVSVGRVVRGMVMNGLEGDGHEGWRKGKDLEKTASRSHNMTYSRPRALHYARKNPDPGRRSGIMSLPPSLRRGITTAAAAFSYSLCRQRKDIFLSIAFHNCYSRDFLLVSETKNFLHFWGVLFLVSVFILFP